jgi:hypothetical protein
MTLTDLPAEWKIHPTGQLKTKPSVATGLSAQISRRGSHFFALQQNYFLQNCDPVQFPREVEFHLD